MRWIAGQQWDEPLTLNISTDSLVSISIRRIMLMRGDLVFGFGYHPTRQDVVPVFPEGVEQPFSPSGPWTGDYTSMIRIAEVT